MPRDNSASANRFPIGLLTAAVVITAATFVWQGWDAYDDYRTDVPAIERDREVIHVRGVVIHLDEVLTMSTRMAAATGDPQWEQRYKEYEPKLDTAIKRAMLLTSEPHGGEAVARTDAANIRLVEMEQRAFKLVRQHRLAEARTILSSAEYEEQKLIYSAGMSQLTVALDKVGQGAAESHKKELLHHVGLVAAGIPLLLISWLAVLRATRRWRLALLEANDRLNRQTDELSREITERKRVELDLQEAKKKAEEATRTKSAFLANMSHEIRTPMTAILGFSEQIGKGCPRECEYGRSQHREHLATVSRNADHLLRIINDILDLSKIEAGKMTAERIACSTCTVIAEAASVVRLRAEAKGLAFNIEYTSAVPETIQTDPTRLRQILINLIINAIKFTHAGGVRLVISFVDDADEPLMQFDVVDTGVGMTDDQLPELFKPFTQGDASTTRKSGGTGLGLSISRQLAQLLGGDIALVETKPGVGTRFRITIATGPLDGVKMIDDPGQLTVVDAEKTTPEIPTYVGTDGPVLAGARILLAEDGPDNQRLIAFILKKAGAEITVVENGKLAVDKASAARRTAAINPPVSTQAPPVVDCGLPGFDVILMDMQMPVMDGYEATRVLRKKGYTGPIIALTAYAMEGDRENCIEAGCDDYAAKPINQATLVEIVRKHLQTSTVPVTG